MTAEPRTEIGSTAGLDLSAKSADGIWKQVLDQLGDMTADFASYYERVAIAAPDSLVVYFREGYTLQKESCEQPDRKAQLEKMMARVVGRPIRIDMAVIPETRQPSPAPAPSLFQLMREKESHPFVRQAVELFDAEVIKVDVPRGSRANGSQRDAARRG